MVEKMKKLVVFFSSLGIIGLIMVCLINDYMLESTKKLLNPNKLEKVDCILILGAGIENNKPSFMLKDRLDKGIELYQKGVSNKILMSGDHGRIDHDEVNVMKNYAIEKGVPASSIYLDHAGFSTYDSIYRAKYIFGIQKMVIVSQKYHLPRALYLSNMFQIDAYGIAAEEIDYAGNQYREIREVLARNKDFVLGIIKPPAKYLGEKISLSEDSSFTNG